MSHVTPEFLESQGLSKTFPARFFSKVNATYSCWTWTGATARGYGHIGRAGRGSGNITANRASWILHFGPIPIGLEVLHDCPGGDNSLCVNPAHLWLGTHSDNISDAWEKGQRVMTPRMVEWAKELGGMPKPAGPDHWRRRQPLKTS
jgi:hypothetical protein